MTYMDTATRNLAWKLNWYRQSELEGALLLGRLVRLADTSELITRLTSHCADEARHAQLWAQCLAKLGLPFIRIQRSYQSLFLDHGGAPTRMVEVLAFTQIFERRVHKRFKDEIADPGLPAAARDTFLTMIHDEKGHLEWVHVWLKSEPEAAALLQRYQQIDLLVYRSVLPFENGIWELPGLGQDLPRKRKNRRVRAITATRDRATFTGTPVTK
jgi:hypothetical protein